MPMSSLRDSPVAISGPSFQKVAELDEVEISHYQPFQMRHRRALELAVGRSHDRILAEEEIAFDLVVEHVEDRLVVAVVATDTGQPPERVIVFGGCGVAPPRLQEADEICIRRGPETLLPIALDRVEVLFGALVHARLRHGQVAGKEVEKGGDIGRPLDAGVAAKGENAAARASHVSQQQLDDRRAPDVLHAHRVLRPAHRVHPRSGALAAAVCGHCLANSGELIRGHAADLLHHLGCVPRVVAFEDLKDAERILEGFVPPDLAVGQGRTVATELVSRRRSSAGPGRCAIQPRRQSPCPRTPSSWCRRSRSPDRSPRRSRPADRRPGTPR